MSRKAFQDVNLLQHIEIYSNRSRVDRVTFVYGDEGRTRTSYYGDFTMELNDDPGGDLEFVIRVKATPPDDDVSSPRP